MSANFIGHAYIELLDWLLKHWINEGPPICCIEGFSGTGKTSIARNLVKSTERSSILINMPGNQASQVDDLLLNIATELDQVGYKRMADAVTDGTSLASSLSSLLRQPIIIVIDEFQNAFLGESGNILKPLKALLDSITNRPNLNGRILLLSNRSIERSYWSESYAIKQIEGLSPTEAEELLVALLEGTGREQEVSEDRRRDVVNWLGRNPRAIHALVAGLKGSPLDELVGLQPEAWELRDRPVSSELLKDLEFKILNRVISYLSPEAIDTLNNLSVYRKPFKRAAVEGITGGSFTAQRDELIS